MALANHIHREETGRYHARLRVPLDLVEVIGKKELWKACNTTDPETAKDEKARIVFEWRAWFRELRQRRSATENDIQRAVYGYYSEQVAAFEAWRRTLPTDCDVQAEAHRIHAEGGDVTLNRIADVWALRGGAKRDQEKRRVLKTTLQDHYGRSETVLVHAAADEIIQREHFALDKGSPAYRDFCLKLIRAWIEALLRAEEHDRGEFGGKPVDPIITPGLAEPELKVAAPGESIMELYAQFCRENPGGVTADTQEQNGKIVKLFAEFIGETSSATAITKAAIRNWKKALFLWPLKAGEIKAFKGMTFREVLKANEEVGKPTISEKTINKYLSGMGGFCGWLRGNDYIESDPLDGMFLKLDKEKQTVFPYTPEQLQTIFSSPVFVGARSNEDDYLLVTGHTPLGGRAEVGTKECATGLIFG